MKFRFRIQEESTYTQTGTVSVEAESHEEGIEKVLSGDFDHDGDTEIEYDSEIVHSRTVIDPEDDTKEWGQRVYDKPKISKP